MNDRFAPNNRTGEAGGPGCAVTAVPISRRGNDGTVQHGELLSAAPHASEQELLRTIASRLGLRWGKDEQGWWAVLGQKSSTWSVWRQDDSGNEFLVSENLTETQAKALAAELEARGHKQSYWTRDESP